LILPQILRRVQVRPFLKAAIPTFGAMKKIACLSFLSFTVFLIFLIGIPRTSQAQLPQQWSSAEILHHIEGLNTLGSVLYLAAHPDDENTRFISYCANELHMRTAYLSITRGDGGQNLIGKEIGPELGLIRTNELLMARSVDGGLQYFTPSKDFGYSKSPEETLEMWGRDMVLEDVVRVIRHFRPDVIVCRFPTDGGGGHGHHTASALLADEAFYLAADGSYNPKGLQGYPAWQTKRIVVNTGRWWKDDISVDDPGVVSEDVGAYVELLGTSCTELAARSRSKHKSQGFGSTGTRGEQVEYFEHLGGTMAKQSLFDEVNRGWSRVDGSKALEKSISDLVRSFDPKDPSRSIPALVGIKKSLAKLPDTHWAQLKVKDVDALIVQCAGLYAEARTKDFYAFKGDSLHIEVEFTSRNRDKVLLKALSSDMIQGSEKQSMLLEKNKSVIIDFSGVISRTNEFTTPYWLKKEVTMGRFNIDHMEDAVKPVSEPSILVHVDLEIDGADIDMDLPVNMKWNDPVKGESWRPFVIGPELTLNFNEENLFLLSDAPVMGSFTLTSHGGFDDVSIELKAPEGWQVEPLTYQIDSLKKDEERIFTFSVISSFAEAEGDITAIVNIGKGEQEAFSQTTIDYEHIPTQFILRPSALRLVKMNVLRSGGRIGYVPGAGDKVAEAMLSLGYEVHILNEDLIKAGGLEQYKAIITGIRLLNVDERLDAYFPELLDYAKNGGNLIVQYNTRHGLKAEKFSPYPITLSRDRVTEEDSEVHFLAAEHHLMTSPNTITQEDFKGWVQERGLYFPSEWDEAYTPILSWHDEGEDAKEGALLIAPYGKGNYVYTGISFFRELPAGVPGAFRLFVNLIESPKHD
jgi:LmbE family N-acetylglucosaminyl deacetylase